MARILIVDDDEQLRSLLSEVLRRAGHEVDVAGNGQEALRLWDEQPADLIVTDLLMPEKDGLEMISELCRSRPELRIIAMTGGGAGMHSRPLLRIARALGASHVLYKPFSIDEFLRAVAEALQP